MNLLPRMLVHVGHVERVRDAVFARRGDRLLQAVGPDVAGKHTRAARRKGDRDRAPKTMRGTGHQCGAATEFDIHAGCRSRSGSRFSSSRLAVESARLPGMADFITVDATHTFIMNAPRVREQVAAFLADGRFRP